MKAVLLSQYDPACCRECKAVCFMFDLFFFRNHLLRKSTGIDDLGAVQWPLIVCLAVSWFTCFMCLFKGIKSMGKVRSFKCITIYFFCTNHIC